MLSLADLIAGIAGSVLKKIVVAALPGIEAALPTFFGLLLKEALSLSAVQAFIVGLEGKAAAEVGGLVHAGLADLEKFLLAHFHGRAAALIAEEYTRLNGAYSFTVDELAKISAIIAAGKSLKDVLDGELKLLGISL